MKIFFFTQYLWPENFRINELIKYFDNEKNKNLIFSSYPSYPNKKKFTNYKKKDDKLFFKEEVIRAPVYLRNVSNISIILNYLSFFFVSIFYGLYVLIKKQFEVIFVFCPSPIINIVPIIIINKLFKKKVVIWVLDLWPNTIVDLKILKNKFIIRIFQKIMNYIYDNSDLILAQSEPIKNEIQKITKTKCIYFPSWPESNIDENKVKYSTKIKHKDKKTCRIMFTGNIGEAQSFETLIEAASILKKTEKIEWIIVGDGRWKSRLIRVIKKKNLEKDILLLDSVPVIEMQSFFNHADALYLSLKNNPTFNKTIPGKLQTYMSAQKPIIASISGETNKLIKNVNCGLVSEAENVDQLIENIKKFINLTDKQKSSLAYNGKNYAEKYFNKKIILNNLEKEIKEIINY